MGHRLSILLIIGALFLSACATAAATPETMVDATSEVMTDEHTGEGMSDNTDMESVEKSDDEMMEPTPEEMMKENQESSEDPQENMGDADDSDAMLPEWFSLDLTNVNSGEKFKVEDFRGKVVLVETMAMWCSTCLRQQKEVIELHSILGDSDDFVSLTLDIDPNEVANDLETYTQNNGFYWVYAISPPEVSSEISNLYGNQFLNPPSAPMFIIDSKGQVHPLRFGVKDTEELLETLQPFLDEVM